MKNHVNQIVATVCLLALLPIGLLRAQQLPFNNQYLLNKYSLSPAYAGYTSHTETFASFRQNWVGVQGAPEKRMVNVNGSVNENTGLGLSVERDNTGIFEQFSASLAYAYHLPIDRESGLHFGLAGEAYNNRIDVTSVQSSANAADPLTVNYQDYGGTTLDFSAGVAYHYQNFSAGLAVSRLVGTRLTYDELYEMRYTLSRQFLLHASYLYEVNRDLSIEPIVVMRTTTNSPFFYEASVMVNYQKSVWGALTYRKTGLFGITAGGALSNRVVASYSYEFGGGGMMERSKGTHEVSLGYLIRYADKKKKHLPSIFKDQPPSEEEKILEEQKKCCDENSKRILEMQKQIDALQKQIAALQKCCSDTSKIKELRDYIKILEIEINDLKNSDQNKYEAPLILENIYFETNSDKLETASYPALDVLVKNLKDNPAKSVKITGHTDNVGDLVYNYTLSKRRAESVKAYLVSKGIDTRRIVTDGVGWTHPLAPNDTEEGRAKNRRIEISFTKD